jgi:hypothetical protein
MAKQTSDPAKKGKGAIVISSLVELALYAVFVFAYFFAVLHFFHGWLKQLFDDHKTIYAVVALGLMVGQALLLELVTAGLFWLTRGKKE